VTKGSASFYRASSNAEVVAMGAIAFSWAVDGYAAVRSGLGDTADKCAQQMVINSVNRWLSPTVPPPPVIPDAGPVDAAEPPPVGPDEDGGVLPFSDAGPTGDASMGMIAIGQNVDGADSGTNTGSSCSVSNAGARDDTLAVPTLAAAAALVFGARRRRRT
jgi:hypothetical protein